MKTSLQFQLFGLLNIAIILILVAAFYVPNATASAPLNSFGYNIGSVQIAGISFEHEWVFMGILMIGIATFEGIMIGIGSIGYLSDFNNLFNYPYGFFDYTTNPIGSTLSLMLGLWLGLNLWLILRPSQIGDIRH